MNMNALFRTEVFRPRGVASFDERNPPPAGEDVAGEEMSHSARAPQKLRFPLVRFSTIKSDQTAQYLIKGLLQSTGLAVVWGAPKCGKSFWTFDLFMHVALNRAYRGHRVTSGPVVYCALEGKQGFVNRIAAFRQEKLSEAEAEADPPFYLMAAPLSLVRDHGAFVKEIGSQLSDQKPIAVCIDTLNRSLDGSESSDEDMAAYVRAADAIRDAFGCLVLIVHHCGHNGERPRGHSSLMGALDIQIAVRRDAANNIVAELELAKDGEVGLQFLSRLKVVEIGTDQDGDPITSCVIEAVDATEVPKAARAPLAKSIPAQQRLLMAVIAEAIDEAGEEFRSSVDGPIVRGVSDDRVRERYYGRIAEQAKPGEDRKKLADRQRQAFNTAMRAAVNAQHLCAKERNGERFIWLP
jgi:AAA domain